MRRAASPRLWPLCLLAFIRGAGSIDCFRDNFLRKDQDTILHKRCRTLDFSVSPKTFGVVGPAPSVDQPIPLKVVHPSVYATPPAVPAGVAPGKVGGGAVVDARRAR